MSSARTGFRTWPRAARLSTYVAAGLVVVLLAAASAGVVMVRRPFPQTTGETVLPGLTAEVTVVRDRHGIPHLYAENAADLFYAQGYVQAQDRFWQMDAWRHITAGRLSELLGEDALPVDKFTRTMGWRRVAEQEMQLLRRDTVANLEAFSKGVTAYVRTRSPSQLSVEYTLLSAVGLDYEPEEWTPVDSLSWLKAMAWDLHGNTQAELERAVMSAYLPAGRIAELYPPQSDFEQHPVVSQGAVVDGRYDPTAAPARGRPGFMPAARDALARTQRAVAAFPELVGRGDGVGSNAWVVDGDRSATGAPILANDPHLAPSVPGIWYQMGLHCTQVTSDCPYDVAGFTFAGVPGVVLGHNRDIAWGFTNLEADVSDLYLEKIQGHRYRFEGRLRPLVERDETIEVLGRDEPFTYTVRETHHGPLMSDVDAEWSRAGANATVPSSAPDRGNGYGVAIAWTGLIPGNTMDALFGINGAGTFREFRQAARDFKVPSQNLLYADRAGHIGYQAPGAIPIRRAGHDGSYPSPGWSRRYDWTGRFVPFEALPHVLDPESGFIVSANQKVVGTGYPYYLGSSWDYGYRANRIVELLRARDKLSLADMAEIQLDTRNGLAPRLVPHLLRADLGNGFDAAGQRLLRDWDQTQPVDSAPAAYFNAVWRHVLELTFHDDLPELVWPARGSRWFAVVARLLERPGSDWWDDRTTEHVRETRDDILRTAMIEGRNELIRLQDRDPGKWTWGHHHVLDLRNATLGSGSNAIANRLLNRGTYAVAGGDSIVLATAWNAVEGYDVVWAPSMRMVVSLGDFDDSRWINLTGASGHAFGDHYVDQTELWAEGETLAFPFSREAVDRVAEDTLVLAPGTPD